MTKRRTSDQSRSASKDKNRDPLSGASGSHPVGTGAGAAAGAASGAAIGAAVGGPIGLAVGGVGGAIGGGLVGKGIAEAIDPTAEESYWREHYTSRPYVKKGESYDKHRPAYRYGWESRSEHPDKTWDEVESSLGKGWEKARGKSKLEWTQAKMASRDAWQHAAQDDPRTQAKGGSDAKRGK